MQEFRYGHLKRNFSYKCLNMPKAVLPYPVWNKVKPHTPLFSLHNFNTVPVGRRTTSRVVEKRVLYAVGRPTPFMGLDLIRRVLAHLSLGIGEEMLIRIRPAYQGYR
jgi:hypothetical protein